MNEGRFWAWRPLSQTQSGDVSLHPPCADTACKYTAWQMAWLCGSPPTNLWQEGPMPERLADRPCLIHCHKRHIVYRTERHCNTNTNTPRVGDTLGKPLVCGSSVSLKENIAKCVAAPYWNVVCYTALLVYPADQSLSCSQIFFLALLRSLQRPCSGYTRHSLAVHVWLAPNVCVWLWLELYKLFSPLQIYFHASLERTCSRGKSLEDLIINSFFPLCLSHF